MTRTDSPGNFNVYEVQSYAKKMKDLMEYMFTNVWFVKTFDSFYFNKNLDRIYLHNSDPTRNNFLFSVGKISKGMWSERTSNVSHNPFPYKMEYFENGTLESRSAYTYLVEKDHTSRVDHNYYSVEQLEDEGFIFQQSLVLDEQALFGVCCTSWLYHMGVRYTTIICELDINEMNRVHKVVFNDDKS